MEKKWYIYCAENEFRLNEIDINESLAEIKKAGQPPLDTWFAWCDGMADWLKVLEITEFQSLKKKAVPPPLPPKIPPGLPVVNKIANDQQAQPVISIQKKTNVAVKEVENWVEKRKHTRYNVKLKVIVSCNGKTFRSFTRDVSTGGVKLESSIPPEMIGELCEVFISSTDGKRNIKFMSISVGTDPNASRISFQSSEHAEELNKWVLSEVEQKKKVA